MTATQQLDSYRAGFTVARDRLHALAEQLSADAFNWKPSAKGWSVGECIVHLNKSGAPYVPILRDAVAAAPAGSGPFSYGWLSRQFIEGVRPGSRAIPTVGSMKPPTTDGARSEIDKTRALSGLDTVTDGFLQILDAADGRDLAAIKVRSPALPIMRLTAGAFLEAMSLHALRHTGQAERVASAPGFPG